MNKDKVFRSDLLTAGGGHVLKPTEIPEIPIGTSFGKAVVINQRVFVSGEQRGEKIVQIYDVKTNKWSTLPPSLYSYSGATIIKDQLTRIGGLDTHTNKLVTWTGEEWLELYPPMHTARSWPGVLAIGDLVIVSGGFGADGRDVDTIEFLDVKNKKWIQSNLKLPRPLSGHDMALCGEYIYIYHHGGYFWRMNKKNFMASLTNNEVHHWEELENAPVNSSLLKYSTLPVLVGPEGIFIFEKKKWTQISKETSYPNTCTASLNGTTFLTFGGSRRGQLQTRAVQYDIAVEEEDTSLKEGGTSLEEGDTSLKEGDTSLKEGVASLKDEFIIFKEKEMKEKQTLIDQVERLKQSEREYELKVQELMKRNTQLKTEVADSSSKGTEIQQKYIGRLEERVAEVTRELRDTQKDNLHLKERNSDLKESNIEIKESNIELKESISELRKTNSDLRDSNSQTTEKIAELTRELRDAQKDNLHLKERNSELMESNSQSTLHLEERINDLKKTNSLLEEGNSELKTRLQQQQQSTERVTELQEENIKLREEKCSLEASLNTLKEEKAKTEKQAEELRSDMLGKVEGFGAMLAEMKRSLDMLEETQRKGELMSTELTTNHMDVLLRNVVDMVPQKWEEIAICLHFGDAKIASLKGGNLNNEGPCKDMLRSWLRQDKDTGSRPRTLKTLYNALVDRDCRPEADKLVKEVKGLKKE